MLEAKHMTGPEDFSAKLIDLNSFVVMGDGSRPKIPMKTLKTKTAPTSGSCANQTRVKAQSAIAAREERQEPPWRHARQAAKRVQHVIRIKISEPTVQS